MSYGECESIVRYSTDVGEVAMIVETVEKNSSSSSRLCILSR